MTEIEKLQKELEHYKEMFGVNDVATKGYRAVVKMLKQQIDVLNDFDIQVNVDKGDKKYDRVLKMFNEMPGMILELKELKDKLGVEYVEKVGRITATTPQSIGMLKTVNS